MERKKNKVKLIVCFLLVAVMAYATTACSGNKMESSAASTAKKESAAETVKTEQTNASETSETVQKDILWKFKTDGGISASPVLAGDILFFGSKDGNMYAVSTKSKELLWKYQAEGAILSQAALSEDKVFFCSVDTFYALDINTGKEVWKNNIKTGNNEREGQWDYHDASPVIDNGIVYFGSKAGVMYGFDTLNGKKAWKFDTQNGAAIRCTPLIHEGIMYFGDWKGKYYAVNIKSGKVKWATEYGKPFQSESIIDNNTIYFGGRDACIHAVDIETGKDKWRYYDPRGSWISGDPVINDGKVYFGTSDGEKVYAMNMSTGKVDKKYRTYRSSFNRVLIHNNMLYVATGYNRTLPGSGKLEVYDLNDNSRSKWEVSLESGGVFSSPVLLNDVIYFGCEDGYLYAVSIN